MFNIAYSEGGCKKFFVSPFFIESNFHKLNTDLQSKQPASTAITTANIGQQHVKSADSAVDQTARNVANNILPASIGEYGVTVSFTYVDSFITFATIPFPNADKYNLNFRMTSLNNRITNFDKSRFVLSNITRSGFSIYTNDADVKYWIDNNKGNCTIAGFSVSGTLK